MKSNPPFYILLVAGLFLFITPLLLSGNVPGDFLHRPSDIPIYSIICSSIGIGFTIFLLIYLFFLRRQMYARELKLQEAYAELNTVFNNSNVGIVLLKKDRIIKRANPRFAQIFGYEEADEIIGKSINEFHVSKESFEKIGKYYSTSLLERKEVKFEIPLKHRSGAHIWGYVSGRVIDQSIPPDLDKGIIWVVEDISKRKDAEVHLTQALLELDVVFESSAVGILYLKGGRVVHRANSRFSEMFGYRSPSELKGKSSEIFHLNKSVFESFGREYYDKLARRQVLEVEYQFKRRDGSVFWGMVSGTAIDISDNPDLDKGVVWVVQDIEERKQAELEILQSQRNYKLLFNSGNDLQIVCSFDEKRFGFIEKANTKALHALGMTSEVLYQLTLDELFESKDHNQIINVLKELNDRKICVFTTSLKKSTGDLLPVEISCQIYDRAGELFALSTARDISKRLESEKLREDVQRITQHDLKTPLSGIISLPQLMIEEGDLTETQEDYLVMIHDSGQNMLNMINRSLDLYKMETGAYRYMPVTFNLVKTLKYLNSDMQKLCQRYQISVHYIINGREGITDDVFNVFAEELLLMSVLSNIIGNAVEASSETDEVFVYIDNSKGLEICVKNSQAVDSAIRDRFFDKYVTAGKKKGTGLGTYSAKLMVETMGGTIQMESDESLGTKITIRIPSN